MAGQQPSWSAQPYGSQPNWSPQPPPAPGTYGGPPPPPSGPAPSEPGGPSVGSQVSDTASAVFGEMRAAVGGASKREPYPFLVLGALAFTVIWLVWPEDDKIGAQNLKLWTVFVLLSTALLFTPMVRKVVKLDAERAWQFCVGGAAGLGFAWVAFLLPTINSNQAFFGTLGAAAAGLAAWTAPGRPK
jgi:hypothetical protein